MPQLQIPEIPTTECPKGNVAAIFNYFFQNYLGRATINIPGLGDVTPEKIQEIEEELQDIQNQIDALDINVRSGTVSIAINDNNYSVAFTSPMPDANYSLEIEFVSAAGTASAAPGWAIVSGTKTAAGFQLRAIDITADITSFFYTARQIPT